MAKNKKKKNERPEPSKSVDSVRQKITRIEETVGDFSGLITSIQSQNETLINESSATAINTGEAIAVLDAIFLRIFAIDRNVLLMAKHMLNIKDEKSTDEKLVPQQQTQKPAGAETGAQLERATEDKKVKEKEAADREDDKKTQKEQNKLLDEINKKMQKGGVLDLILGGAMALAGFIAGFVGEYIKVFQKVLAPLTKWFNESKLVTGVIEAFKGGWAKFATKISELVTIFTENAFVGKVINLFKTGWATFVEYFKGISTLFQEIAGIWGKLFGGGGGNIFKTVMTWFEAIGTRLGLFFELGSKLGKLLGKIAIPLQVIMSIWDTVTGALDGWNKTEGTWMDKLIGAVKGGLTGLLNGLIGGLLDLLKDGLSWVLEFFGFKDAAAWLDSFKFTDIITEGISRIVDSIVGFFKDMVAGPMAIIDSLKALMSGKMDWGDFFKNVLAGLVRMMLAPVNAIGKIVGFDVTEKALDLLGLPKTGGKSDAGGAGKGSDSKSIPDLQRTGDGATGALAAAQGENKAVNGEKAAAEAATTAAIASNSAKSSNRSQTVVNNAGPTAVISSSSTKWNMEDMWARGGMSMMGA